MRFLKKIRRYPTNTRIGMNNNHNNSSGGGQVNENIVYTTQEIAKYFGENRIKWQQFYDSERWIMQRLGQDSVGYGHVLDVGCAAGGLGAALGEKFKIASYTGVDINARAIELAKSRKYQMPTCFMGGDVLKMSVVDGEPFDTVFSLSCADWNIETDAIIKSCWSKVKAGGKFIISLRLTSSEGVNDINKSYQYICYEGHGDNSHERANYVVLNAGNAFKLFATLNPIPSHILGYGYWGSPSQSARTNYDRLVFAVFAIEKGSNDDKGNIQTEMHLPLDLFILR